MWVHDNINTIFILVVGDFCVQYSPMDNAEKFLNFLRAKYLITFNMEATVYIGIKLDWYYVQKDVTL